MVEGPSKGQRRNEYDCILSSTSSPLSTKRPSSSARLSSTRLQGSWRRPTLALIARRFGSRGSYSVAIPNRGLTQRNKHGCVCSLTTVRGTDSFGVSQERAMYDFTDCLTMYIGEPIGGASRKLDSRRIVKMILTSSERWLEWCWWRNEGRNPRGSVSFVCLSRYSPNGQRSNLQCQLLLRKKPFGKDRPCFGHRGLSQHELCGSCCCKQIVQLVRECLLRSGC